MDLTGTIINGHRHIQRELVNTQGEDSCVQVKERSLEQIFPSQPSEILELDLGVLDFRTV